MWNIIMVIVLLLGMYTLYFTNTSEKNKNMVRLLMVLLIAADVLRMLFNYFSK